MKRALLVVSACAVLIVAAWAGIVYFAFGSITPCGVLRETTRRADPMVALLPDSLIDFGLTAQYGALSPSRCIDVLLTMMSSQPQPVQPSVRKTPTPPQPRTATPPAAPSAMAPHEALKAAFREMEVAANECRAKRLRGELPSYAASANCSNPRIVQAFARAHYRYMDLIDVYTAKRFEVATRQDRKEMTEDQANAEIMKAYAKMIEDERRRDSQ